MTTLQKTLRLITALVVMTVIAFPAFAGYTAPTAPPDKAPTQVLVTNVRVFDGTSDKLTAATNVLVENNLIKEISATAKAGKDATVIDGGGRILMPGLIDAHGHLATPQNPLTLAENSTWDYTGALMGKEAERMLMRGITTMRDAGGPVFGLKRAIDQEWIEGPRIFPSGAIIGQTSGHGDFRTEGAKSYYFNGDRSRAADLGYTILADGVPEVQKAVRENFRMQASQIKIMAGGGVASITDPLDAVQYTFEEMKAAGDEAKRWGTYVMVHALVDEAVVQSLDAGVKSIDHGAEISEKTLKRMAKEGAWLVPTAYFYLQDVETNPGLASEVNKAKARLLQKDQKNTLKWAKKYGVKIA